MALSKIRLDNRRTFPYNLPYLFRNLTLSHRALILPCEAGSQRSANAGSRRSANDAFGREEQRKKLLPDARLVEPLQSATTKGVVFYELCYIGDRYIKLNTGHTL